MSEIKWEKPSAGSWEFDGSHQSTPFGRFLDELILEPTKQGFAEGFRTAGVPLAMVEPAIINGWYYTTVRPLGGPPEGGSPPPKLIFWLLFKLVPELRRRQASARRFFAERRWTEIATHWEQVERPAFELRLSAALDLVPAELTDQQLSSALLELSQLNRELTQSHFAAVPSFSVPTGDYLVHSERWGGIDAKDAMRAVGGYTQTTSKPIAALDAIVEALRDATALDLLLTNHGSVALDAIASASPQCAQRLADYRREYGTRMSTDYSPFGRTLNELPELLVDNLRQRVDAKTGPEQARTRADAVAAQLRARIPEAHRAEWDELLGAARICMNGREDHGGLLLQLVGLLRVLLLEIGTRLVARGRADEPESAFDLTCDELVELLAGRGPGVEVVREHTALRRRNAALTPPQLVGPASAPPPLEVFPKGMQRLVAAMFAFISRFSPDADPIVEEGLAGHGVSAGVVTGRARLIRGNDDFERFVQGDILLAKATSPAFNVLLSAASAVVTETGGLICHAAIVAREFGIPGIVGVRGLLDAVPDGALIRVDGDRGTVEVLQQQAATANTSTVVLEDDASHLASVPSQPGSIVPLAAADESSRFGGKAASLSVLARTGVVVPWGIALDVDATQAVAAGDESHLQRLREALRGRPGPFAVRSSATVEDSGSASFAGQFRTELGVMSGEEVVQAVGDVWRSGHNAGVHAYQKRLGLSAPVKMAVVVQELVGAQSAGVLFFDPDKQEHIIEASWGYGETVVDGSVSPDRYTIDSSGKLGTVVIGDKKIELVKNGKGLKRRDVDTERAKVRCLDDSSLCALAELGHRATEAFGDARDIEWALTAGGLVCLQARPITRDL